MKRKKNEIDYFLAAFLAPFLAATLALAFFTPAFFAGAFFFGAAFLGAAEAFLLLAGAAFFALTAAMMNELGADYRHRKLVEDIQR